MADLVGSIYKNVASADLPSGVQKLINRFGGIFFPLLLCIVLMDSGIYIYTESSMNVYSVIAAVFCILMFALLSKLRKIRFGGLIYFAILFFGSFIPGMMLTGWRTRMEFVQWFFSGGQAVESKPVFLITFTLLFSFFFCSVVFYFSQVIYRSAAVVLISLIPMALYVKAAAAIPTYYPILIASIDLIIFIFYSRRNISERSITGSKTAALVVYTDFAVAAIALSLIIPKPTETPFYEKFESFMNIFQFGGSGETAMSGEYNRYSGNADNMLQGESRLLYVLNTQDPAYMKTQVFDRYDAAGNRWESLGENISGSRSWQENAQLLNYEKLSQAFRKAAEYDPEFYEKYPSAALYDNISEKESYSIVYSREFPTIYVIAPMRTIDVNISNTGARYSVRSDKGEIFTSLSSLPGNTNYIVRYYSEEVFYSGIIDGSGLCSISAEEFDKMLNEAIWDIYNNEGSENESCQVLYAFLNENTAAMKYKEDNPTEVSDRIQELADSITEGLEYDNQKARAIEQYFYTNGFAYNLTYQPPEGSDTPEYFLFESKLGTCSDFATAYTLLARAAGLTVRYTEGFVPDAGEDPTPNTYYIYTENAHAYPEVYIPGAGWIIYEPTQSDNAAGGEGGGGLDETDILTIIFTAVIGVICLGIFLLFIIFKRQILETFFRATLRFSENGSAVRKLYVRHAGTVGSKYGANHLAMTAEEISSLTEEKTGMPLSPLADSFVRSCYGGIKPTDEERASAYDCYKKQYKEIYRKKKKRKDR